MGAKRISIFMIFFLIHHLGFTQKVISDTIFPARSALRTSQLVNVTEDPYTGNIRLIFRQENQINSQAFYHYEFSRDLNLVQSEGANSDYSSDDHLRRIYPHYRGEFFTQERFGLQHGTRFGDRQRIEIIRYTDTYRWNWFFRDYHITRFISSAKEMEKLNDDRNYLVHQFYHEGVDKVYALIAFKERGKLLQTSPHSGAPLLNHYQLVRIDRDLNLEVLRDWEFPFKMELVRTKLLNWSDDEHFLGEERINSFPDPSAQMLYVFAPAGGAFVGNKNPQKGNWFFYKLKADGQITEIPALLPGSGWKVVDVMHRNDTILLWGPVRPKMYYTALQREPRHELSGSGVRYRGFQLVRIIGDKIEKVSYKHLNEFRQKANSQAKRLGIAYRGAEFIFSYAKMGPSGELFIGGQRIREREVREQTGGDGESQVRRVREGYKQPILMCFNQDLKLNSVLGYRYYRWLIRRDDAVAPMWVRRSAEGKWYWEVSELYDVRTYGYSTPVFTDNFFTQVFGPSVYHSMNRYLFFPRLIPIEPSKGIMKEPVNIGLNEKGRQRYYSDNLVPWKILSDGSLLYIGYNAGYSSIWLGKVQL